MITAKQWYEEAESIRDRYLSNMWDKTDKGNWDVIFAEIRDERIFLEKIHNKELRYLALGTAETMLIQEQIKYI